MARTASSIPPLPLAIVVGYRHPLFASQSELAKRAWRSRRQGPSHTALKKHGTMHQYGDLKTRKEVPGRDVVHLLDSFRDRPQAHSRPFTPVKLAMSNA